MLSVSTKPLCVSLYLCVCVVHAWRGDGRREFIERDRHQEIKIDQVPRRW